MKKFFTIAAVAATITISAQQTASVNVSIVLKDVMSISVADTNVLLNYESNDDYKNGVKVLKTNHLTAFSTSPYKITSSVATDNLITQNDIYLNNQLQTRDNKTTLFTDAPGEKVYNVEYRGKGNYEYLLKEKKTYTTQVIYTITAQ